MPLAYLPRRIDAPEQHIVCIVPNEPEKLVHGSTSPYKCKVVCSCQWEALALNQAQADWYAASHRGVHGIIG